MAYQQALYGAIEAGGTKFVCGVADEHANWLTTRRIETRSPEDTVQEVLAFFAAACAQYGALAALGVGTFGPIELNPASAQFGHLLATPKPGWSNFDLVGPLRKALACPVGLETDVTAAGLAEARWGAARELPTGSFVYVTVGTGIGGGVFVRGEPVRGLLHPELGHILPRRHPDDQSFPGVCPFHGDCLEGLASGPAIQARAGRALSALPADDPTWDFVADALGQLCATMFLVTAPEKIVFGGGVGLCAGLVERVVNFTNHHLAGYLMPDTLPAELPARIVRAELASDAGLMGAWILACRAHQRKTREGLGVV